MIAAAVLAGWAVLLSQNPAVERAGSGWVGVAAAAGLMLRLPWCTLHSQPAAMFG